MPILLLQVAVMQVGVPFRAGLDASPSGGTYVIQMRDTSSPVVSTEQLARADVQLKTSHHQVLPGDILFRSRGQSTTASVVREAPPNTIAAAPLMRIRVTAPNIVLPEYLNWYLNQRPAQTYFTNYAKGTMQMMVDKTTLENLEVAIPSLDKQKQIMALADLMEQEQGLMQKLSEKRRQRTNSLLLKLAENV